MARPPATQITVEGLNELVRAIKGYEGAIDDLKAANLEAAGIVQNRALDLAPARTGRLRNSIRAAGQARAGVVRSGSARVPYAGPIHFGWAARNIKPQPFLYDALDDRRDEVVDAYERNLAELARKHNL